MPNFDAIVVGTGGVGTAALMHLAEGGYVQCHACRRPLSSADLASPDYREGVACPKCVGDLDPGRAARLEERAKQVALARRRGAKHIGPRDN